MLQEFLKTNRTELIARCTAKVAKRPQPPPTDVELKYGIPLFLDQLTKALVAGEHADEAALHEISGPSEPGKHTHSSEISRGATKHGDELLRKGFTVDQVVHDYGDLCQAVTELAVEKNASITVGEFRVLNSCLDNAIAGAVTEFGRLRDKNISSEETQATNETFGSLAHELRNLIATAMLSVQTVKRGNVGLGGATGAVLDRSLIRMRNLIDRSLAEVRSAAGLPAPHERIDVAQFIQEIQVSASLEAQNSGHGLTVHPVDHELEVDADRQMLASAISNLLQNAFKFTRPQGNVSLKVHEANGRVLFDVQDECGGLPPGKAEGLFRPFEQRGHNRTGLGLGLAISHEGVTQNGGKLTVRNLSGHGCIFTIDLPARSSAKA